MKTKNRPSASPRKLTRMTRGTRAAIWATPATILLGWLSPHIYGVQLTLPRVLCAIAALGVAEALVEEGNMPVLERELVTIALGGALSLGLAVIVDLLLHGSF